MRTFCLSLLYKKQRCLISTTKPEISDELFTVLPAANNILPPLLLLWRVVKDAVEDKTRVIRSSAEARDKEIVNDEVVDKDKVEDSAAENE
jgi:hypothetical protein